MEPQQTLIVDNEKMQAPVPSTAPPEIVILALLDLCSPINLDDVACLAQQFTWNQLFHAIDVLSRQGKISLRRRTYGYEVMGSSVCPVLRSQAG